MSDPVFYGKPLTFGAARHMYFWGGQHVPSVTTIINRLGKENLIQWAANCAVNHVSKSFDPEAWHKAPFDPAEEGHASECFREVLEEARYAHRTIKENAAGIGTRVHKYAQQVLQGQTPPEPLDGPAQQAVEAFWRWVESHKIEPIAVERRVMSESLMYAGTCDFFGHIDGVLSILDFKTGKGVYNEAWWQTAGYEMALAEELGADPSIRDLPLPMARWIVHLNKETGECVTHCRNTIEDWQQDRAVWLGLVKLDQALRAARKHPQTKRKAA